MLEKTNANVNTEVKVDALEASKALMANLLARKVMVKPTLLDGYYTVKFQGISFIETKHKAKPCMAVQIKYALEGIDKVGTDYEELQVLDGSASPEAQQAAMGQIERYMQQLAEQFGLIGVDVTFDELNKFIGTDIDIKVYQKEFQTATGATAHARKFGFWKKPVTTTTTTETTEVPKF